MKNGKTKLAALAVVQPKYVHVVLDIHKKEGSEVLSFSQYVLSKGRCTNVSVTDSRIQNGTHGIRVYVGSK